MKNIYFIFTVLILLSLSLMNCSKNTTKNLTGIWKADSVSGMPVGLETHIYYEFTKDKMIASGTYHGEPLDKIEAPYTIKSDSANILTIEVIHPSFGAGIYKIIINGKTMNMTDPDKKEYFLTKSD